MKLDGPEEARCICGDISSPKYQSSVWQRSFMCVYSSKKRYRQNKNTGNFIVLHTQFM